jgi:hypothetical protein
MTDAQTRYFQMVEAKRHNVEQERNWNATLEETQRANRAREDLQKYANETSRYAVDTQAETSRYATDVNAATQHYVSDQNARTAIATTQMNNWTSRYATDTNAATQRYVSDQGTSAQRYATDTNVAFQQDRLEFDKSTQAFMNDLNAQRLQLERLRTSTDVSNTRAQTQQIRQNIRNSLKNLELEARRLDLNEAANAISKARADAEIMLNQARTAKTIIESVDTGLDVIDRIIGFFAEGGNNNGKKRENGSDWKRRATELIW